MNRVKAGVFSFTPPAPPDDDGSYLRWHLLDHMPEQYQLPGIVLAQRWIADGDYASNRIAGDGPLADIGNAVNYLVADPVQQTFDDFMSLGRHLAKIGRFPERRPSLMMRMLTLRDWHASPRALVSDEVVPFRPHRGVVLVVEESADEWTPEVLDAPGVAGLWRYGDDELSVSVIYLDDDPLATTKSLTPLVEQRWRNGRTRPQFAGPLRTMMQWDAWP